MKKVCKQRSEEHMELNGKINRELSRIFQGSYSWANKGQYDTS